MQQNEKINIFKTVICKNLGAWDERLMETPKKIISRNKYFEDINTEKGLLSL